MRSRRRTSALVLLAVAAALVTGALAAYFWGGPDGGFVVLGEVRGHFVTMGWLLLVALIGAVLLGARKPATRLAVGLPLALLGVPLLSIATLLAVLTGGEGRTRDLASPGRDDRRLVIEKGFAGIDPVWTVYVHQGSGPLERRWTVGSFNGDATDNALRETVWTAPDRIRMTTEGGEVHEVTLAPGGLPDRTVSAGW
ncbi:hypothetical protein [Streptomyces sp. NBC_01207]|uniref:hypothetical protein n=1 Tax=Streptomyces sp. NBC_01207 TaxID=2903772 RepID=UPI002E0DAA64|nr:hypothetical protein OG457_35800 [Streptomyces sp. NBC_01207]